MDKSGNPPTCRHDTLKSRREQTGLRDGCVSKQLPHDLQLAMSIIQPTQNDPQDAHGVSGRSTGGAGSAAPRQRREQYFTFSQSRAHFLRQAKGRPQWAQGLVGRSAFERIFAMALPGHGLAAPVEEAAVGLDRKFVDDGQQVAGRFRGRVDVQPGRCEGSRKCGSNRARMHGDTECFRRSTRQFHGRRSHNLVEGRFGRTVRVPTAEPIIADASDPGGQGRKNNLVRPGQQRKHMLHDQRGSNRVQREGTREIARIELAPTLLGFLAIIVEKPRCIDYEPKLALLGGERCGAL